MTTESDNGLRPNENPLSGRIRSGSSVPNPEAFFQLDQLLAMQKSGEVQITPMSFEQIRQVIKEETGANLPTQLSAALHFWQLKWHSVYDPRSLSLLFLSSENEEPTDFESAQGIIELSRNIDRHWIEHTGISAKPDTIFPQSIRMSGNDFHTQRTIIAQYDADPRFNFDLERLTVSLKKRELEHVPLGDAITGSQNELFVTKAMLERNSHSPTVGPYLLNLAGRFNYYAQAWELGFGKQWDEVTEEFTFYKDGESTFRLVKTDILSYKIGNVVGGIRYSLEWDNKPNYPYVTRTGK